MGASTFSTNGEPPRTDIPRRLLCLFNPTKKDNFSDAPFLYEKL